MRRIEVDLSPDERRELEHIVKYERDARMVKRAQALLWLNEGEKITVITHRLQVRRQTVYNWRKMYNARNKEPMRHRLQDRDRPGRPASKRKAVQEVVEEVMETNPRQWGYASAAWSSRLLCHYLRENHGLHVSRRTVRRALHQMGYRYKRPRYVLARRSPTWQQAKGGCSEG